MSQSLKSVFHNSILQKLPGICRNSSNTTTSHRQPPQTAAGPFPFSLKESVQAHAHEFLLCKVCSCARGFVVADSFRAELNFMGYSGKCCSSHRSWVQLGCRDWHMFTAGCGKKAAGGRRTVFLLKKKNFPGHLQLFQPYYVQLLHICLKDKPLDNCTKAA